MRCREVRARLSGSRRDRRELADDVALQQHLRHCPDCAEEAKAVGLLGRLLDVASEPDLDGLPSLEEVRARAEARVGAPQQVARRRRPGAVSYPWWLRQPVVGLSMVAAVLALAAALVPIEHYQTTGYDIRFGGVRPELVQEEERICNMLSSLGLDEAAVDVLGCDSTCSLRILDLKTSDEVELVASALRNVNRSHLTVKITPLRRAASRTLLDRAQDQIFDRTT